jgi:hypothetical protein
MTLAELALTVSLLVALGLAASRVGLSAIPAYLLAGLLLGPNEPKALSFVRPSEVTDFVFEEQPLEDAGPAGHVGNDAIGRLDDRFGQVGDELVELEQRLGGAPRREYQVSETPRPDDPVVDPSVDSLEDTGVGVVVVTAVGPHFDAGDGFPLEPLGAE